MTEYNESSIKVLEFPETIRMRPGMYLSGNMEPTMLKEILDNALDELPNCKSKTIAMFYSKSSNTVAIRDFGRGIPVGKKDDQNISTLDLLLTTIHSGGKFNKENNSYENNTIGMNGVGASAVNALSDRYEVFTCRDSKWYRTLYKKGIKSNKVDSLIEKVKGIPEEYSSSLPEEYSELMLAKKGTLVIFKPDEEISRNPKYVAQSSKNEDKYWESFDSTDVLKSNVLSMQFLMKYTERTLAATPLKTRLILIDTDESYVVFDSTNTKGLTGEVERLMTENALERESPVFRYTENGLDLALAWGSINEDDEDNSQVSDLLFSSWCNNSITLGGSHCNAVISGVYAAIEALLPRVKFPEKKNERILSTILSGLVFAVSYSVKEPMFVSQSKTMLETLVPRYVINDLIEKLKSWLSHNAKTKQILDRIKQLVAIENKVIISRNTVLKSTTEATRRSLNRKLIRSTTSNPEDRELYIVEGESAGGSARQARDSSCQEILKLRGKILNIERYGLKKAEESEEVMHIVNSIYDQNGNPRVGKVFIMADSDADGGHITLLVMSVLEKMCPEMIRDGKVYFVDAPLFYGKSNKRAYYGMTLNEIHEKANKAKDTIKIVQRIKGWGEMNAGPLKEIAFDKETRMVQQIEVSEEGLDRLRAILGSDINTRIDILKSI